MAENNNNPNVESNSSNNGAISYECGDIENESEQRREIFQHFSQKDCVKDAFFIFAVESSQQEYDIRVSKFFGAVPVKEGTEIPCCSCGLNLLPFVQLYIPGLPERVRELFPQNLQDALIVLLMCGNCLEPYGGVMQSWVFHEDEIDQLHYVNVECEYKAHVFNSISCVKQVPSITDDAYNADYIVNGEHVWEDFEQRMFYNYKNSYCYFGGYPNYCQNDENPGNEYSLILSLEEDVSFPLMWGDCGNAQIWLKNDGSNEFFITWSCC